MKSLNYLSFLFLCALFGSESHAQKKSFDLSVEGGVGYTLGATTTNALQINNDLSILVPDQDVYANPVIDMNLNLTRKFFGLDIGVGAGIGMTLNDENPVFSDELYNRVYFPLFFQLGYDFDLFDKAFLRTRATVGYSFMREGFRYDLSEKEYHLITDGGINAGFTVAVGSIKMLGWTLSPKVSYTFTQFRSTLNRSFFDRFDLYCDIPPRTFYTDYHILSVGIILSPKLGEI